MTRFSLLFAATLFLFVHSVGAEPSFVHSEFREKLYPSAKIAGAAGFVRAVMERSTFESGTDAFLESQLVTFVPEDRELCLLFESRNGLYVASRWGAVQGAPGWMTLPPYSGDAVETLRNFGERSLAISALLADDCLDAASIDDGTHLLLRESVGSASGAAYVVLAHVDRFNAAVEVYERGVAEPVAMAFCDRFEDGGNVAYNVYCDLPKEALDISKRAFLRVDVTGKARPERERISLGLAGLQ